MSDPLRPRPRRLTYAVFMAAYSRFYDLLWDNALTDETARQVHAMLPDGCSSVLDVGAGTGLVAARLAAQGLDVRCVEPDAGMRRRLARRLPQVTCAPVDLDTAARTEDLRCDAVVAVNVLHFHADPDGALDRLFALCSPGGTVVVVTPRAGVGVRTLLAAQRRAGVPLAQRARFALLHVLLAPLTLVAGMGLAVDPWESPRVPAGERLDTATSRVFVWRPPAAALPGGAPRLRVGGQW